MGVFENVRNILKEKNIQIRTFEDGLELSRGGFYRWKDHAPSIEKVKKAAEFLNVDINEIVK